MTDEEIRMRCLELANVWEADTVERAQEYFDFVKSKSRNKLTFEKQMERNEK